jgi:prespore-specific regulator
MGERLSTKTIERKDGWTPELDQLLLDTVTEGLCEGLTQVACFAKAAQKIGKSKSACAFRFNTTIRKQASEAIERAKNIGKSKRENQVEVTNDTDDQETIKETTIIKTNTSEAVHALQEMTQAVPTQDVADTPEQPSIDTVIHMLQRIQQHNGLAEENTIKRKLSEIQQVVNDTIDQFDQLKIRLQNVLEDMRTIES